MLPASLCAKIMVFRRITRIIGIVLNERAVHTEKFRHSVHGDVVAVTVLGNLLVRNIRNLNNEKHRSEAR